MLKKPTKKTHSNTFSRRSLLKMAGAGAINFTANPLKALPAPTAPDLGNYVVIVAHQDDEVIWLEPLLQNAKRIVIVHPILNTHLKIIDRHTDWYRMKHVAAGGIMALDPYVEFIETYIAEYETGNPQLVNAATMQDQIENIVIDPDIDTIVTHNPWGEYGYPHHRY